MQFWLNCMQSNVLTRKPNCGTSDRRRISMEIHKIDLHVPPELERVLKLIQQVEEDSCIIGGALRDLYFASEDVIRDVDIHVTSKNMKRSYIHSLQSDIEKVLGTSMELEEVPGRAHSFFHLRGKVPASDFDFEISFSRLSDNRPLLWSILADANLNINQIVYDLENVWVGDQFLASVKEKAIWPARQLRQGEFEKARAKVIDLQKRHENYAEMRNCFEENEKGAA